MNNMGSHFQVAKGKATYNYKLKDDKKLKLFSRDNLFDIKKIHIQYLLDAKAVSMIFLIKDSYKRYEIR